jgi:hypothetical protein
MNRRPTAAKIINAQAVDILDQHGNYMNRVSFGSDRIATAFVGDGTLAVNLTNGRLKVFAVGEGHSPVLRYTR